jgi:hypothetical protein
MVEMSAKFCVRPWVRAAVTSGVGGWLFAVAASACDRSGDGMAGDSEPAGTDDVSSGGADTGDPAEPAQCDVALGAGACAAIDPCEAFECGGKTAPFNHYGCPRVACTADSECGGGERCFAVALDTACRAAATCEDDDGTCTCGAGELACIGTAEAHCLPIEFYPATGDCEVEGLGCEELSARAGAVEAARSQREGAGHTELAAALAACADAIEAASAACAGKVTP